MKEQAVADERPDPPVARIEPHTVVHHGHMLADGYAWLQRKDDPAVLAYIDAENAYASAQLRHTAALQEQLFGEMRGRIKEDDSTAPQRLGAYFYYSRMEAGKQYRIFCRRHGSLDAPEEVLLDENALAAGLDYCRVHRCEPSPDHSLMAYSVDTTGAWVFELYVKDLRTGATLAGPIPNTAWSFAWASDNRTLFYTVFDDAHRAYKLLRHTLGDPAADAVLFEEPNETFAVYVARSKSGAYLWLTVGSHTTSEVHYLAANQPEGSFELVEPRRHWQEYYVEHHGERFLIWTNDQVENFKLMEAPAASPSKAHWRELIAHRADTLIESVVPFRNHLVVHERRAGLKHIRISEPDGISNVRYVPFPEPVYTYEVDSFLQQVPTEFDSTLLRFIYTSLVTPESTWTTTWPAVIGRSRNSRRSPAATTQRATSRRGLWPPPPTAPRCRSRWSTAAICGARAAARCCCTPTAPMASAPTEASTASGSACSTAASSTRSRISVAAASWGRAWYENGRLMHKRNSFTDFIACAEHLIEQGYTTAQQLAIMGGSAGGLLMGAVANMRPDLFKAVVAMVPFTNVITAMMMPDLPLTVTEYEQWGNPADPQAFDYMLSYSPYENVVAQDYPHIYAKAGLNDLQVPYWDPAKWVARLRAHKTDANRLLLVTNMGAGHIGASGRYDHLREDAQVYAFLIDTLGVAATPA
jgi:oligopeptidase B